MSNSFSTQQPSYFAEAIASVDRARVRDEITLGPIRPPQKLAPYSYAISAELMPSEFDEQLPETFGRLIMLYDPDGEESWNGTLRLVSYIQVDIEEAIAGDPLLPEVAWSWLRDNLEASGNYAALGGTVTSTTSIRYGDMAGPAHAHQLELRASWTPQGNDLSTHVESFCKAIELAAGLPPTGVTSLKFRPA